MRARPAILLDDRDTAEILKALLARRFGYAPEWKPENGGYALAAIFARYLQAIIQRLNQAPDKNKLAFLDVLGIQLIPAQAARTPVVFRLAENVPDARLPAGTRVSAPPPPERNERIIFETERATGLAVAKLKEVVSLWPGRDQYIDHSAAFLAGQSFEPFKKRLLQDTPHHLYLAHDTLLALAGKSSVDVIFELTTTSSEHLDILWEYWDGKIWREFMAMRPSCDEEEAMKLDGTNGLQRSGRFRLQTDCAETKKTTVNRVEAFWVRGRLTEPLPLEPAQVLPEVDDIKLTTEIAQPIDFAVSTAVTQPQSGARRDINVNVQNEGGKPLKGVKVEFVGLGNQVTVKQSVTLTDDQGELSGVITVAPQTTGRVQVRASIDTISATTTIDLTNNQLSADEVTFILSGLKPDKAFADQVNLDLTQTFYPFGAQPQPGTVFYFTSEEIFSKPAATAKILLARAETPQDTALANTLAGTSAPTISVAAATPLAGIVSLQHVIAWEYWNGLRWVTLFQTTQATGPFKYSSQPDDFSPKIIELPIPKDMVMTKVNDEDGFWMRARLVSGGFGVTATFQATASTPLISFVITQPPALAEFLLGYTWQHGPFNPEHVLTYNDFQYEDQTEEAKWPGQTFQPFKPVGDVAPGLYLGFDTKLPVDRLGILFDIMEQRGDTKGPPLLWQYWDGISWEDLTVEDETQDFRLPGLVSFIGPDDSEVLARFNGPLHWLRARLKEDGPPGEPVFNNIHPNAAWAVQQQTITDEPIGASTGQPNQVFKFRQIPVLAGPQIEVREVTGARANAEWRLIASDMFQGNAKVIGEMETMLGAEGPQTDIEQGDLRLKRDRNKRVTEVWIRWREQRNLFFSGPADRYYVVDRARGWLMFGDGTRGKVPPPAAAILARQYRTGGGSAGNVAARAISQVVGPIGGVEAVFNPLIGEGGADGETLENYAIRGPKSLRHRRRAILPSDYETLAFEASSAVAAARAIPARNPAGRPIPGWVTLLIIPESQEPRPWPSFGLREQVRKFIEVRAPADLAAARQIYVTGPDYLPIDVSATVAPIDPAGAGEVETRAREALGQFLHPLRGGPEGHGWVLGRDVFLSDVAAVLERVPGVDYVEELGLLLGGALQGERVAVAPDRTTVAGDIRLKLKAAER